MYSQELQSPTFPPFFIDSSPFFCYKLEKQIITCTADSERSSNMNDLNKIVRHQRKSSCKIILLCTYIFVCLLTSPVKAQELTRASTLPDLSGLSWVEDDLFLGIHDAKRNPEKYNWPRVSIVRLPESELQGVIWRPLNLKFPGPEGRSSDMESASRIPGGKGFLFSESGQEGEHDRRIFYASYKEGTVRIESHIQWPVDITNVEATEVCRVGDRLVFLYAERADSAPSTRLRWARLSLDPLKLGKFEETIFKGVDPVGDGARPIVALDVDSDGFIYIVSAYDSGSDGGPYRSVVWRIGKMVADGDDNPLVRLDENRRLANLDGLKVESIAVRELNGGGKQIFVGTDDEHYGGIIRLLPGSH
jgi:hypothetical protein